MYMATKIETEVYLQRYGVSEDYLRDAYLTRQLSLPDIEKEKGIPLHVSVILFRRLNIPTRSISESKKLNRCIEKCKASCLEKYGVENPSQAPNIKDKKKKTFISHYGVDNVWKSEEFKQQLNGIMIRKYGVLRRTNGEKISRILLSKTTEEKAEALEKRKNTNREKYGMDFPITSQENADIAREGRKRFWENLTDEAREELIFKLKTAKDSDEWKALKRKQNAVHWNSLSDDEKRRRLEKLRSGIKYVSSLETRISRILSSWRSIDKEFDYKHLFYIGHRNYDFLINRNLILEVQGDYWHATPKIYTPSDMIDMGTKKMTAQEVWERDRVKEKIAVDKGYKVVYIWENEMRSLSETELEKLLVERLSV
jgi:G:T-mismatch repair DNA endonuclease (very short patch repair protein)